MEREAFNKLQLVNSLIKIAHSEPSEPKDKTEKGRIESTHKAYTNIGLSVVNVDPYLYAHIIAWNHKNGKLFSSKLAFPVISLRGNPEFSENAIAHLTLLDPRKLIRAYNYSKHLTSLGNPIKGDKRKVLQWAIQKYIEIREKDRKWWDSCVVQNRKAMKALYTVSHKKPSRYAQSVLFDNQYPKVSVFEIIRNLKNMSSKEAAGHIINHKIPLTIATGAVSSIKNNDIILALLEGISGNELLNNTKRFEKLGVLQDTTLKAAFEEAIERAKKDKRVNTYKASKAKEVIKDKKLSNKIMSVQKEREKKEKGIEGNWSVLGDCSWSMKESIEIARKVASLVASAVKGKVYLIFFNTAPKFFDVSGMSYDDIFQKTQFIIPYGGTSIGCGLDYLLQKEIIINGIVIASDGGDNTVPMFDPTYKKYTNKFNINPTVYHIWVPGDPNRLGSLDYIEKIDASRGFDEYVFPNLTNILKANRYQLMDDILDTPLLTFKQVFKDL